MNMPMQRVALRSSSAHLCGSPLVVLIAMFLSACASITRHDPVQVYVVGIEPLQGEGLELRMLVKLRVQNPNDAPIQYDGVYVDLDVQNRRFASGVSDAAGEVPRFGETVLSVPVSVSAFRLVRSAMGVFGEPTEKIEYELSGKLAGPVLKTVRFNAKGEMSLPKGVYDAAKDRDRLTRP
jgi:LEA14-like dessication related protein